MAVGRVVSVKNLKTATVLLESTKKHPLYKKTYKASKKYLVDDTLGVKLGDIVEFVKCAPVSKRKHWRIVKVLGQDIVALGTEHMKTKAEEAIEQVLPEEKEEVEKTESKKIEVKKEKPEKVEKVKKEKK